MVCEKQQWANYSEETYKDNPNLRTFFHSSINTNFFMLSRYTAFQTKYLKEVIVDVELGRSFDEIAERYSRLYSNKNNRGQLYKKRVEDAFFLLKLLEYFRTDVAVKIHSQSNRIDIEDLCDQAVTELFSSENRWKEHRCHVAGCREGLVVCDGNEKLHHRICAAPQESLKLSSSMPKTVSKC